MWALLNDAEDAIEELIQHPKTMVIAGTTYPRQVFKWSAVELKGLGIVPVTTTGSHLDTNYYIEVDESFAIASDKVSVVQTIGVKAADHKLEYTTDYDALDFLSNGFKLRLSDAGFNGSEKYTYMAWAENPFKYLSRVCNAINSHRFRITYYFLYSIFCVI